MLIRQLVAAAKTTQEAESIKADRDRLEKEAKRLTKEKEAKCVLRICSAEAGHPFLTRLLCAQGQAGRDTAAEASKGERYRFQRRFLHRL